MHALETTSAMQLSEDEKTEKRNEKSLALSFLHTVSPPHLASLCVLPPAHYLYWVRLIKEGKLSQIFL